MKKTQYNRYNWMFYERFTNYSGCIPINTYWWNKYIDNIQFLNVRQDLDDFVFEQPAKVPITVSSLRINCWCLGQAIHGIRLRLRRSLARNAELPPIITESAVERESCGMEIVVSIAMRCWCYYGTGLYLYFLSAIFGLKVKAITARAIRKKTPDK